MTPRKARYITACKYLGVCGFEQKGVHEIAEEFKQRPEWVSSSLKRVVMDFLSSDEKLKTRLEEYMSREMEELEK